MLRLQPKHKCNACKPDPAQNQVSRCGRHNSSFLHHFVSFFPFLWILPLHFFSTLSLDSFHFSSHLTFITSHYFFAVTEAGLDRGTRVGACFGLVCFGLVWRSGCIFRLGEVEVKASHVCGLLRGHQGAVSVFGAPACLSCFAMLHSLRF
ncbi:hypothetical protein BDV10DRAFT_28548 [Aspergillus recurvatus]